MGTLADLVGVWALLGLTKTWALRHLLNGRESVEVTADTGWYFVRDVRQCRVARRHTSAEVFRRVCLQVAIGWSARARNWVKSGRPAVRTAGLLA